MVPQCLSWFRNVEVFVAMVTNFNVYCILAITCKVPSDIVFVLDGSDSLKAQDFLAMKNFVNSLIDTLEVDADNTRVGVVVFSTTIGNVTELGSITLKGQIQVEIARLTQPRMGTNTAEGLSRMITMFNTKGKEL